METGIPRRLPDTAECVSPIADVPHWSENFCFTGWDTDQRLGLWLHMGRTPYDQELWHEMLSLHLPGGDVLIAKNFSRSQSEEHPHGQVLELRPVQPWVRWSIAFAGPMKTTTERALHAAPLADGRERQVELELTWSSDQPPWEFGGAGAWATGHYQQMGTYAGTLRVDGVDTALHMQGWRDHSVGPRDLGPLDRHNLMAAQFEDGSSVYAQQLVVAQGEPVGVARIGQGTAYTDVEPLDLPAIDDTHGPAKTYAFPISTPEGAKTVNVEVLCSLAVTMFAPNDMVLGLAVQPGGYVLWMGQGRFELDGVIGYGYVERSGRVRA
jgi:hypothetical protein